MPKIAELRPDLQEYINIHGLWKKWVKAKSLFENNPFHAAEFLYKTTDYWAPQHERCILWNDAELAIDWEVGGDPVLSAKDAQGGAFRIAEVFP